VSDYTAFMRRALDLAALGRGLVEPNPMVGAVLIRDGRIIAEGRHERFGGPHAEVNALAACPDPAGATLVVSLEPCCHVGKTPPCTQAIIRAGVKRVVAACRDPYPLVAGRGLEELRHAGIDVIEAVLEAEAHDLNAPFFMLRTAGRPWVIAKWAMTLDGRIATATGDSRWISGEASRRWVHDLRGRVDAILVGLGTVLKDDPLLTCRARPLRVATRVVLDALAETPLNSQLVRTAREAPVIVAAAADAPSERVEALRQAGAEVLRLPGRAPRAADLAALLAELGRREMTNVLVEGGATLLGSAFDAGLVDEVAVFVAPLVVGAAGALAAVAGNGVEHIAHARRLVSPEVTRLDEDVLVRGRVARSPDEKERPAS
jgi:diaminohydroxyphosphoribosylaminopyrimidine deaminase/5-amino-6-(5-phosphoribosylamino)uracil reductase